MGKLTPRTGPKLKRDWVGLRVSLRGSHKNGHARFPEGMTGTITRFTSGRRHFEFTADKCEHCGIQLSICGLYEDSFTILTPRAEWKDTSASKRRKGFQE